MGFEREFRTPDSFISIFKNLRSIIKHLLVWGMQRFHLPKFLILCSEETYRAVSLYVSSSMWSSNLKHYAS